MSENFIAKCRIDFFILLPFPIEEVKYLAYPRTKEVGGQSVETIF